MADAKSPNCPQPPSPHPRGWTGETTQSEDCLYLNIWRPAGTTASDLLPVMVWIHGGSFRTGAGSWSAYDGTAFTDRGVILVTINYRLGALGRFAHPAILDEQAGEPVANYYLMDQVAALQWVQEHIGAFGGDHDNVTIFGYSAGGVSVNYLMAAPSAEGLFHKAISQSGGIQVVGSRHVTRRGMERLGEPLVDEGIKLAADLEAADAADLRALSANEVLAWQNRNLFGSLNPVQDGVLIPISVGQAFREGRVADVPYLAGATDWEASLLHGMNIPPMAILGSLDDLDSIRAAFDLPDDDALMRAWFADNAFVGSARYLASQVARNGDAGAWLYTYSYVPEAVRGAMPGAAHGDEVPAIFGRYPGKVAGLDAAAVTEDDRTFSTAMTGYWVNFAKTGNPNGDQLPDWPPYDAREDVWMSLGERVIPAPGYRRDLMEFLNARYERRMVDVNHSGAENSMRE